jgi:predicted O-methyltransferase YrrM
MKIDSGADAIYSEFKEKPGSDHIASANAINTLMWVVERWRPKQVLEVGSGIGTLTRLLLDRLPPDASLTCVEGHDFCVAQFQINVGLGDSRMELVSTYEDVPAATYFDLIVVDGGSPEDFVALLGQGGVVFVEGDRSRQRELIEHASRRAAKSVVRSTRRSTVGGPTLPSQKWEGGASVYKFEPGLLDRLVLWRVHAWDGSRLVDYRRKVLTVLQERRRH